MKFVCDASLLSGPSKLNQQVVSEGHDYRAAAAVRPSPPHKRRRREFFQSSRVTLRKPPPQEACPSLRDNEWSTFSIKPVRCERRRPEFCCCCLEEALASPQGHGDCYICVGNNPLISPSAMFIRTNTCHGFDKEEMKGGIARVRWVAI